MLPRANRVVRPDEFRAAVRRGRRVSTAHAVLSLFPRSEETPARFGFIVAKTVGNAVIRNRVKRRLRAIAAGTIDRVPSTDVVIRALPGIDELSWVELKTEVEAGLERGMRR